MSWFEGIEENTLIKVELNNGKEIEIYFTKVSDGIVEGRLENGKIKKFKEDKIEDLEEIDINHKPIEVTAISPKSQKIVQDIIKKQENTISQQSQLPHIKTSFLNKIDNLVLTPVEFNGKSSLFKLRKDSIQLYSQVMNIINQFNNAKKINELDFKFSRSQKIIRQLDNLLSKEYYEEIDIFLAYVLQEADVSYFEFFKKFADYLYCLKYDIYFYNMKNNNFGFFIAEKLFELYYLDSNIETEWFYAIKNINNFNSFKIFEFQYSLYDKLSKNYKNLLSESIDYIFNKSKLSDYSNNISERIKTLKSSLSETNEYKSLNYLSDKIVKNNAISNSISIDLIPNENSFSSLGDSLLQIMQPKIEEELNKILHPNGIIKKYFNDRKFGFITDKKGNDYYFTIQNIIDKDLLRELESNDFPNRSIEVCYSISYNYKGEIADVIQKPKQIKTILDEVEKHKKNKHFNIAQKSLEQILAVYPNNLRVKKIYRDIINTKPSKNYFNHSNTYESYGGYGNYRKAKDAKDRKDYETAIKYFLLALENLEKLESTIKDLALTYYESGDIENSKKLLFAYEDKLSKTLTTYNFLENHYFAVSEYNKSIEYIDILLKQTSNKNREILLLGKKANCYLKLKNKNRAKEILKEILLLQPDNNYAKRLLDEIKTGKLLEDIDIDISSFGGGLSKFINDTLTDYDEYAGVPPKVVESKDFQIGTLREIRKIIDTAGRARPKERAAYLLTEAKLMQDLEPDNDINQRKVLARYCNAMALNHISENSPKEVIRFFYLEAFNLEEDWKSLTPQIALYLLTYIKSYNELLNTVSPSIDNVLTDLFNSTNINIILNGILDVFIWNNTITKHLSKRFFDNQKFKKLSINFLNNFGISTDNKVNFSNYTKKWDEAREKQKRIYDNWFASIRSLAKVETIDELITQMITVINNTEKNKWLSQTDKHRLNILLEISQSLSEYLKQKTFDDKERTKNYLITKINELIDEIKKYPTKFSYEGYKPLLEYIERLITISFEDILKSSIPDISIEQLGNSVIDNKKVSLQLSLKNTKNSSPISNVELEIKDDKNIKFIQGETEIYTSIRGGEEKIIKLDIKVTDNIIKNLVTDMGIIIKYNRRGKEAKDKKEFQIPIKLYTSEEFKKIENLYAPIAEGGPVKDKSMFYGRDEYIGNIVNSLITSNAKSIIIYGQKRSGKSSVLYHLKNRLQTKENAFCIDFSMGEIIEDLTVNSTTFYYKILEKIEEKLENIELEGNEVPEFIKPNIEELNNYPTAKFNEALKKFDKSRKLMKDWKDKKLVILIDEFTYVYSSIEKGEMSSNFMKTWKAFIEKNHFSAVLIGQDVAPKFKQKYPNEFGVTEDKRLTYLSEEDAEKLIEEPIWDKERNSSRYIGRAIEKVIDYTACSPYYLQMFCARVVDYMNRKKAISVTESDIEEVANSFIEGAECLSQDKFDNLFTAGDADIETFDFNDVESVLIQIAKKTNIGSCSRDDINIKNKEKKIVDDILNDLVSREVIQQKENFYQIKVGLFKKWLLKQ